MSAAISRRPFESNVFEPGSECVKLLYNKPSNTLVAHFRRVAGNGLPKEELYLRSGGESEYRKVQIADPYISCWDPLSCRRKPFVFFNAMRLSAATGGNWVAVSMVSLPGGHVSNVLDSSALKVSPDFARAWIASILDVDDEGRTMVCRIALEADQGAMTKVHYFVSEIDVITGNISNLVALPNAFV